MNRIVQLTALVLFLSIQMMAQPLPCFNFEDIPAGTQLGPASGNSPGDVLFSQAGIQVSIQEIQYSNGNTGFGNAQIMDAGVGWLDGQFFFMGNNSLHFDLSQADGSLNRLCFDFFDGGGEENFAVNGSAVAIVNNFSEIANLSFPGVSVDVDFTNTGSLEQGTVCITGDIESLLIGGQEFGIDNVCADAVLACPIANLRAEIVACDDAGNYDVEVDFDWLSPLTVIVGFGIFVEGEHLATINQTQLPYLLEGVQPATDALVFTLTVCQNDNPNCCASVIVPKQCPPGACLEFEGLDQPVYGNSAGTPPGTPFYTESGVSLLLIPFQSLFWTNTYGDLIVLDEASAPEMTAASGQYLRFESVNAVFDLTAYPDPVDSVVVDFYYSGGAINLAANGTSILIQNALMPGLYALAPGINLRVVFDSSAGGEGRLVFYGNIQSLLIGGAGDFRIDNLCVNPRPPVPCRMGNMAIELGPCDSDGNFQATIDFGYQGTSDSFRLFGPGVDGNFAYTSLPVTVGPIPNNNSGIYAFFAKDFAQDGCYVSDTIQAVPCTGCAFEGLSIDYLGLAPNGQNAISLDLELVGPTLTDFFSVYFDGQLYERFSWNNVPLRLLVPCNATGSAVQEITVCEGEDHCCVTLPLVYLEPCAGPCSITNVEVQPGPCNPNNVFEVKLDFDYQNTSDSFELWLNGNATNRFFAYADLPVVIGPFVAPTGELEFQVVDAGHPDCAGSAVLPAYNCGLPCPVDSVAYYLTDCNDAGNYAIVIEQVFPDPPTLDFLFYVSVDGVLAGSFSSSDLPIDLGPFPGNGAVHEVAVYTQPTVACAYRFATEPVICDGACPLQSVHLVGDVQCTDSDFYRAKLEIEGAAVGDILTIISTVTNFSMTVIYNGDFVVVEMPHTGQNFDNLRVCLALNTTSAPCCREIGFDYACPSDCYIEPTLNAVCNPMGGYDLHVDLDHGGTGDRFVIAAASFDFRDTLSYADLPLTLHIPSNALQDNIRICDLSRPNCCASAGITVDCPCPWLAGLTITPNNCRDDGTFTAMLNIISPAPAIGNVFIVESGDYFGEFTIADLPVEIGPFPGTGEPRTVHVFFPGTDCQATTTFITPDCSNGDCIFTHVIAEPHGCDGGQFLVDVEVRANNHGTLGYYIFADGHIFGPFSYSEPFVTIGPFAGDGAEEYGILVLDIADPSCYGYTELGPIDCNAGCDIYDLVVEPLGCNDDGTYNVLLNFEVNHPGNDFFEVFGPNGGLIGYYSLAERPVVVEGLHPTSSGQGRLLVCINDRPNCCEDISFNQPDCTDQCRITDVRAEFGHCDADGNYYVRLFFNAQNTNSNGFRVFGNGQDYGTFSYTMPFPVIVGPIAPTGALAYELIVADLENPECRGFTTFGAFDCNDGAQVCITFDEFENLPNDTINLAIGNPRDSIYDEDGVIFDAVSIPLGNNANYFEWVVGSAIPPCGPMAEPGNLYLNGGVELHFAGLPAVPTSISFDIFFCNSTTVVPQIVIGANGQLYSGPVTDLPGELTGGIMLEFVPLVNSLTQGRIILRGPVEHLLIGGRWLFIDNLCFNAPEEEQEVWPGDANADNIAHHIDLLNIGLAYGFQGQPRFEDGANWLAVSATDWTQAFADGANYKHADCNGDGVVDANDRQVLAQNYGLTHGPVSAPPALPGTDLDPPAYIDFPAQMPVGASFNIPIVVGTSRLPMQDVYGVAFTVEYDPEVFDAGALDIVYPTSWFGEPGVNTITIDRTYADEGRIEMAITRTDHNNVSGHGPVAYLIGIIDDIAGLKPETEVTIGNIVAIGVDELRIPVQGRAVKVELQRKEEEPSADAKGVFSVFPNPTTDWVTVTSKYGYQPEQLTLLTLDGREVKAPQEENRRISLAGLPTGTYILSIRTGDARVHKLIVKDER